ncbi:hypothetical protein ACFFQF_20295 [Haladaptatus pallidirubidus]|uniref:Uncharacterized protein n=1 Tax=Haladaptatus pallidirubidus TaxID=1008152 RepID=A0AAV3UGX6_9EURY|nr:hypothetical protein [Haladaptatus pallidirubidus]
MKENDPVTDCIHWLCEEDIEANALGMVNEPFSTNQVFVITSEDIITGF